MLQFLAHGEDRKLKLDDRNKIIEKCGFEILPNKTGNILFHCTQLIDLEDMNNSQFRAVAVALSEVRNGIVASDNALSGYVIELRDLVVRWLRSNMVSMNAFLLLLILRISKRK
jgi:hypothetical protein